MSHDASSQPQQQAEEAPTSPSTWAVRLRALRRFEPLIAIPLFAAALWVIHRELDRHSWRDVVRALSELPGWAMGTAVALTVLNFVVLTGYDTLGLRYAGRDVPYRRSAFASFLGYAFSNALGFPLLTSAALRFRLYSAWGLTLVEIRNLVVFYTASFWLGLATLAGAAFLAQPMTTGEFFAVPAWTERAMAIALLMVPLGYTLLTVLRRAPLRIGRFEMPIPSSRMAAGQLVIATLDWCLHAAALFVLLPSGHGVALTSFIAAYVLAQIAGLISHVPGGLGVFEAVILGLLPSSLRESAVFGSLLAFRLIYYFLPLLAAACLLAAYEIRGRLATISRAGAAVGRTGVAVGRTVSSAVPVVFAGTTFVAGLALLVSGATPAAEGRLRLVSHVLPLPVIEISHLLGSVAGAALMILAWGLRRRLDAAWYLTMIMMAVGAVSSLAKGLDYEEAIFLVVMLAALGSSRREFRRRASLLAERFEPGWMAALGVALLASIGLALFAYQHVDYSGDLWWRFALRAQAPRALRAEVAALAVIAAFATARLVRPARHEFRLAGDAELQRATAVIATSLDSTAHLALLGDKSLLFSDTGESFLMYAVQGRSWVTMGDPMGRESEREELAWRFRELADQHAGWPVFYQVRPAMLPLYIDLGLTLVKLGEEARVPLETFTLDGGAMKNLRQTVRRAEREGLTFSLVPASEVGAVLPELRAVSQEWLTGKRAREKGFSLGFFEEQYLSRLPLALVWRNGRIEAFANVWLGAEREELTVDLMRHRMDAPPGVMDYLLVQVILWGKAEHYRWFNLGMAPLSGLESRPLAPLWTRLGASVQRVGEPFYNFQGLRQYKEKFQPVWEPRYLASPGGLALPRVVANLTTLIGGGLRGTLANSASRQARVG